MIFLDQTIINTTTQFTMESSTATTSNLIDNRITPQWESSGFADDTSSTTIRIDFTATQTVNNIILLNHNLKNFSVTYNIPLISSFTNGAYATSAVIPLGVSEAADGTLWICDSAAPPTIYNVENTGTLISSFTTGTYDVLATDPTGISAASNGTLWICDSTTRTIYNVQLTGTLISSFTNGAYAAGATNPTGVSEAADGTLWICDLVTDAIYNVQNTGTLISSFLSSKYEPGTPAPNGISEAANGTLWICNASTDKIYNVENTGTLISSFTTGTYDVLADSSSGISVASNGTLWICDFTTDTIYNVRPGGTTAFSPAISETTNSATSNYYSFATVTTVENITLTMNETITADEEKKLGEFIASKIIYDFAEDRLPTSKNYRPEIRKKQVEQRMSDGGVTLYNIAEKFRAKIKLDFVPTSTEIKLRSAFDNVNPLLFIPFETTSSWGADIFEVNWTKGYNFLQFSDNNRGIGFKGQIQLEETVGRL